MVFLKWIVILIYIILTISIFLTSPEDYKIIMGSVLYAPIVVALFLIYTNEENTEERPSKYYYIIKSYLKIMNVLTNLFSKSVSSRYSKLLNLFHQTHKSFTITKKEKTIVEFTLQGIEPNILLYGSIEQPLDAEKINGGNFIFDPSKWVTVSLHTSYEGQDIHIEKSFHQSDDQTIMFNTIMQSYLTESMKVVDSISNEEITEYTNNTPAQKEQQAPPAIIQSWSLIEFARKHGKMQVGTFIHKETKEVFKSCIFTASDGTKTYVAFSSKMGELTPKEIALRKDSLRVAQLESGNYSLYEDPEKNWQDVDLGI